MKSIADYMAEWKAMNASKNQTYSDILNNDSSSAILADLDPEQQRIYNEIKESDMKRLRNA